MRSAALSALGVAPVDTPGIDQPVNEAGQLFSVLLTGSLAIAAVAYCIVLWRRERIGWPFLLLASGAITTLMEPLFDHLYGLWFFEEGQWKLYETFGSNQPVWVPLAYIAFYGGASVFVARTMQRHRTMAMAWRMYAAIVVMALVAEISYVSILEVYEYQDHQPFVLLGYPIFLGFTNAMSALMGGMVAFGALPWLRTALDRAVLVTVVPVSFAMGMFGSGILYLSVRHGFDDPPMWLVSIAALTVPVGIALTFRTVAGLALAAHRADAAQAARSAGSLVDA